MVTKIDVFVISYKCQHQITAYIENALVCCEHCTVSLHLKKKMFQLQLLNENLLMLFKIYCNADLYVLVCLVYVSKQCCSKCLESEVRKTNNGNGIAKKV